MAAIVFVHGINHQHETADQIESTWLPALAGAVRLAGRDDLADRLWPPRSRPDSIDTRGAYYGHLFRSPDQMGDDDDLDDLPPEQAALAERLALDWLERAAASPVEADAVPARRTLAMLAPDAQPQGPGNIKREVVRALSRISWIARPGMATAERFVVKELAQVTRYLTEDAIRTRAREAVLNLVDADTRVIIGHSLGSVVAYECAHRLTHPLPLLVTLGSPLGLRTIVLDRLDPPASFPPTLSSWLNVANKEDVVAAEPDLRPLFGRDIPATSQFEGTWFAEPGKDPHCVKTYLGRIPVGHAVIRALA